MNCEKIVNEIHPFEGVANMDICDNRNTFELDIDSNVQTCIDDAAIGENMVSWMHGTWFRS